MPVEFVERLRWLGKLFLVLFVLGAAAFLSAITAMRLAIEGSVVTMPDLIGRTEGAAEQALRAKGLDIVVADHAYGAQPADDVLRQSPLPGTQVKVGQMVQVVLSLGPQMVDVPNLIDSSLPAARLLLLNSSLQLGEVSYIYSSGEPADLVLQQDPLPGKTGLASPRVSVLVSLGPRPAAYVMPQVTGSSAASVEQRLAAAGLKSPAIATVAAEPGSLPGTVVEQTPAPGARVDTTTDITLKVASSQAAPPVAPMPRAGSEASGPYAKMPHG